MIRTLFKSKGQPQPQTTDEWLHRIETDPEFCQICLKALQNLRLERTRINETVPKEMQVPTNDEAILSHLKVQVAGEMAFNNLSAYQASEKILRHHATRHIGYLSPDQAKQYIHNIQALHTRAPHHKLAQISVVLYHTPQLVNKYA